MPTVEEADRALAQLGADSDRIAQALVAMDSRPGHRLLSAGSLTGLTRQRWAEASDAMGSLWDDFSAHHALLEKATKVRERRTRPGEAELVELGTLLTTLTELTVTLDAAYTKVTEVLDAVEAAWQDAVERLDPLDSDLRAAQTLAMSLGVDEPELGRLAGELAETRRLTATDPLAAPEPSHRIAERLTVVQAELASLVVARDSLDELLDRIGMLIDQIADAVAGLRTTYATVQVKIAAPGLPPLIDPVPTLRHRVAELPSLADRPRELVAALDSLREDVTNSLAEANGRLASATGLLDRRLELRGRLDAYQAKAKHLGYAEDLDLLVVYREARILLYTIPCDLPAATRAVKRYQEALQARREAR